VFWRLFWGQNKVKTLIFNTLTHKKMKNLIAIESLPQRLITKDQLISALFIACNNNKNELKILFSVDMQKMHYSNLYFYFGTSHLAIHEITFGKVENNRTAIIYFNQ
jgi:hypothetical protein